jgi:hypothetical protein
MEFNKFISNPNKILLSLLILCAVIGAGFTVFCQMPGNNHSYNLLAGKDECQSEQSARDCGPTQLSQDTLGFSLLDNSILVRVFSGLLVALLGVVLVFVGIVPLFKAGIRKWFCFQFLTRLHNYLIQAFSQGLLNPRIFAL